MRTDGPRLPSHPYDSNGSHCLAHAVEFFDADGIAIAIKVAQNHISAMTVLHKILLTVTPATGEKHLASDHLSTVQFHLRVPYHFPGASGELLLVVQTCR